MRNNQLIINGCNISPLAWRIVSPTKQTVANDLKLQLVQQILNLFK